VLDVVEELHISDFPIAVRVNRHTPEKLLRRMAEVQRHGGGIVALYNEEVVIDALHKFGYPLAEARRFANDGCWEAIIPGRTNFIYSPFDTVTLLQQALGLNDPEDKQTADYADFESLYAAFRKQLHARLDDHNVGADSYAANAHPAPLVSLFVEDCIERGRGYYDRGAHYSVLAPHAGGIANVANSLLAIRELVYEQKTLSLAEYVAILRANWQGQENLRKLVLNRVPAYGNDDDEADAMVRRIFDDYTDYAARVRERNGVLRPAGISTFGREIEWTAQRKATADGHLRGEVLATNLSASPGTDTRGPTALLKSYCKMDFTKLPNMGTVELKILPASVQGDAGVKALVGLMKSFVKLGGCFMHIDVVDTAMLLDAQRHPDKYPNLAVRVAGWSARFATLNKSWQDMVIARTQQVV
jgi:formate C-acetyltransferase